NRGKLRGRRRNRTDHELNPWPVVVNLRERFVELRPRILADGHVLRTTYDAHYLVGGLLPKEFRTDGFTRANVTSNKLLVDDDHSWRAVILSREGAAFQHGDIHRPKEVWRHGVPIERGVLLLPIV